MRRKVIKQGHNTLTVTLPSKWANNYGIKPGDEIDVTEQEKSLIISTDNGLDISKTVVDISGLTKPIAIWRFISSAYRSGYDEIMVTGIEPGHKKLYTPFTFNTLSYMRPEDMETMSPIETISACVNRLIGVEIVEQKGNYCLIKELSETSYKEFDSAMRRIFLLLKTEAENISNGLEGNKEDLKAIHIIDTNLDRFEDFCIRVLNRKGYEVFRKTPTVYSSVLIFEMIGDEFKKIARHVLDMKKKHSSAIKELFKIQSDQLNRYHKLFIKFNKPLTQEIYQEDENGTKKIKELYNELNDEEKELLHHFKKVGIYILSLTELRIDLEF
ncbi:MAG: AbrB/MazE/SpoVT family DNA-binding domain-containing protein [Nanoarchaeota archaeon]